MFRFSIALFSLLLPAIAVAHPGHGPAEQGAAHWMEPVHSVPMAATIVLIVGVAAVRSWKTANQRNR